MSWSTARQISLPETAKHVRAALKDAYPTVKFSVRSSRYSMGCAIDVSWTDGPTQAQVEPLLNQFTSTSFDGTDDSTHHHTQQFKGEEVRFAAGYVTGQRRLSAAFLAAVAAKVAAQYQVPVPTVHSHGSIPFTGLRVPSRRCATGEDELADAIHHIAHQTSALPKRRMTVYPTVTETAAP